MVEYKIGVSDVYTCTHCTGCRCSEWKIGKKKSVFCGSDNLFSSGFPTHFEINVTRPFYVLYLDNIRTWIRNIEIIYIALCCLRYIFIFFYLVLIIIQRYSISPQLVCTDTMLLRELDRGVCDLVICLLCDTQLHF